MNNSAKYNLDILDWQQFENLSFRCLQEDISRSIQFMDGGKDKGRDFVFEGTTGFFNEVYNRKKYLFQAKHKAGKNAFSALKSDLAFELFKVFVENELKFDYYCLVTNLKISGDQFDSLNEVFEKFISASNPAFEIKFRLYSYYQIESVVDKRSDIKWAFPSIVKHADFERIIDQAMSRNKEDLKNLWISIFESTRQYFIYTEMYRAALTSLETYKMLLLSGPPKSGKTFTAQMILLNKVCSEGFTPIKIDIIEEFDQYYDKNAKQIFLFDDALGRHNMQEGRAELFERKIDSFLQSSDDNHLYVFTNREYIVKSFGQYMGENVSVFINKINVSADKLSNWEKLGMLTKYYNSRFPNEERLSNDLAEKIITHKNFTPESIRAYFKDSNKFSSADLIKHLDSPDNYLKALFSNFSREKQVTLLSVLFSLNGTEATISYAFKNLLADIGWRPLIRIKDEIAKLEGSLIREEASTYNFYHPSMFEFFVKFIGEDDGQFRSIMLKNLSTNLLSVCRFKPTIGILSIITIKPYDLNDFHIGVTRIIENPSCKLGDINTIINWLNNPDAMLYFRMKLKSEYETFMKSVGEMIQYRLERYIDEGVEVWSYFLFKILEQKKCIQISTDLILTLLEKKKENRRYWELVFRAIPYLDDSEILGSTLIGKDWLNNFYLELKRDIDKLGEELYGTAYPDFEEMNMLNRQAEMMKTAGEQSWVGRRKSDYKKDTPRTWYPRYLICQEKISIVKSNSPYGYKIYRMVESHFGHLKSLEDNQRNRYLYNRKRSWWS